MGLNKTYKLTKDTLDIDIEGAIFVSRHYDQSSVEWQKEIRELTKPYKHMLRNDRLPAEKDRELSIRAFVRVCLVGWRNVRMNDDDPEIPFSADAAEKLFLELPRLFSDVAAEAADMSRYRDSILDSTIKN